MVDQKISCGDSFSIRFMISFSDKPFERIDETQEENHTGDPPTKKRFQPRLVYNKTIHDELKRISTNVDNRIKHQLNACKDIKYVFNEICNYTKEKLQDKKKIITIQAVSIL